MKTPGCLALESLVILSRQSPFYTTLLATLTYTHGLYWVVSRCFLFLHRIGFSENACRRSVLRPYISCFRDCSLSLTLVSISLLLHLGFDSALKSLALVVLCFASCLLLAVASQASDSSMDSARHPIFYTRPEIV